MAYTVAKSNSISQNIALRDSYWIIALRDGVTGA